MSLNSKFSMAVFSFFVLSSSLSAQQEMAKVPSAQLSSLKTQLPTETNHIVSLENVDNSYNIDATNAEKIVIKESGTYFIAAAGQVGAQKTGDYGFVDMWLLLNGEQIPNTGARQSVSDIKLTAVLLSQAVMPLKAGDIVSIGFFSNKSGLGLIAFPKIQKEPLIPSIILTIYKIGG